MRFPSPTPRSTGGSILRATVVTAIAFGALAVLLLATRDTTPTSATGTTVPEAATTSAPPAGPATTAPAKHPTSTAKPAPTTTARRRASTTTAPAADTPTTPEGYARGLYAAWTDGSRSAAAAVATPAAVAALFGEAPAPVRPYTFAGCTGAAGSEVCRFEGQDGHALVMKVRTGTGGLPMTVTEVKFPPPGE